MKLTLNRLDLKESSKEKNCSTIEYKDFIEEAQVAIKVVGRAIFFEFDKSNYNAIYPPKEHNEQATI